LAQATKEGRISYVAADPLMRKRASWDLGVNDSTTIWVAQWIGREIRFLDYIEGQGQPLAYYANALREAGHGGALCLLPHDGAVRDKVTATRYEDHLRQAGWEVQTVANQGKGAALKRIEAARRLFPRMWFDDDKTRAGRKALAAYHERRDEKRNVGLGPEHDDASHAADAFGLMAVAYEEPTTSTAAMRVRRASSANGWMGA
jgi:phage terminase large subunit